MRRIGLPLALLVAGLLLISIYFIQQSSVTRPAGQGDGAEGLTSNAFVPQPSPTYQPISPTRTPEAGSLEQDLAPNPTPESGALSELIGRGSLCDQIDCRARIGISGEITDVVAAYEVGLPFGTYFNWWIDPAPPELGEAEFWQFVRLSEDGPTPSWSSISEVIASQPGSIWVIGNEPDVVWQDDVTPQRYAQIYHALYTYIKAKDPEARIAVAGVSQPTPLRLAYLDIVLDTYEETYGQPMPVDVWTIHGFILREEAGSWGVEIPPGMEVTQGQLYEIEDHDNLDIFRQNLIDFRAWMAARGYADRPLALTEFGILHPSDYGFPPERVARFMVGTFDFLVSAANETGMPADDGRLVQWWQWYSVHDGYSFPTGDLFDPERGRLTPLGEVFAGYVRGQ